MALGMAYYNTNVGIRHPSLQYDLLGRIAEACKEKGIVLSAYINAGLSHEEALLHRDWAVVSPEGFVYRQDRMDHFFRRMCYNSRYSEHLLEMVKEVAGQRRIKLAADKGYDTEDFVAQCRHRNVTPHIAQHTGNRKSRIDGRTVRHAGYEISQRKRKRIEECFGWMKTIGLMRKTRHKGTNRVGWMFVFSAAVYNLVRIRNLVVEVP